MANKEHLDLLRKDVREWNAWRKQHPNIRPDLRWTNLSGINLIGANLRRTNFNGAQLYGSNLMRSDLREANLIIASMGGADFSEADLRGANLTKAKLDGAHFYGTNLCGAYLCEADLMLANLRGAQLKGAYLRGASFRNANLREADLSGADLSWSILSEADLRGANLTCCSVYAVSAWNVQLQGTIQSGLIITRDHELFITVDNLKVAQFIYLLLNNKEITNIIDTITSKVVLILGRFTDERKKILDALRDELGKCNYTPVIFDFDKPSSRDLTETVRTLAHLSRFIIADITEPSSIPQELQAIVPNLEVPIQPLLLEAKKEYAMFMDFKKYTWVLPVHLYQDLPSLLASLNENIIDAAEKKVNELALEKAKRLARP